MPTVSGNVGAVFNGGTITRPTTITDPVSENVITIENVDAGHNQTVIDNDGGFTMNCDDSVSVQFNGTAGADATLQVSGAVGGNDIAEAGVRASFPGLSGFAYHTIGGARYFWASRTFFRFAYNAAPADSDLVAGECALWFDQTNGASKLMVKAKQADGAVKTASVALS